MPAGFFGKTGTGTPFFFPSRTALLPTHPHPQGVEGNCAWASPVVGNHDLSLTIDYFEGYPFEPYASGKRGHVYRVGTYYPFPSRRIPGVKEKVYDVVHTGSTTPPEFFGVLNEFKTVHVCRAWCSGGLNGRRAANFEDKLDIVAQSKIAVVFNVLLTAPAQNISSQSWWGSRKPWLPFYPNNYPWFDGFVQWKARTTEAFFGRALVLYRWDPYYSLERLGFIPDKHFVYYNATPPQVSDRYNVSRLSTAGGGGGSIEPPG